MSGGGGKKVVVVVGGGGRVLGGGCGGRVGGGGCGCRVTSRGRCMGVGPYIEVLDYARVGKGVGLYVGARARSSG